VNESTAKLLIVGDNVTTSKLPPGEVHTGTVIDTGYNGVTIEWDDGQIGQTHHRDMAKIEFMGDENELKLRRKRRKR
jgi:ferredoxin-fold anticodon binding domain-containing protein